MENKQTNIEQNQESSFFTKKKILMYVCCVLIFALIIFLVYKFVIQINFKLLFTSLGDNSSTSLFPLWLTFLILFPCYNVFVKIFSFGHKLKQRGVVVEWYNWLIFSFLCFFIGGITPFAMGAEPYMIYWLTKRGLKPKEATAIVASFTVINPFIQVLITWPSFFYVCSMYQQNSSDPYWLGCFWAVFCGLMFDLMATCFWLIMSLSKKIHFWINYMISRLRKMVRLSYKTKEEIKQEYVNNAAFQKAFIKEMKDIKFTIALAFMSFLWNAYYYAALILAFNLLNPNNGISPWDIFNYVNIASTANNFIPIPGAEGTLQGTIATFIRTTNDISSLGNEQLKVLCDNSVFVWRFFTFYITTLLGLLSFVIMMCQEGYKSIIQSKRKKVGKSDKVFNIIVYLNGDISRLKVTLMYLISNQYHRENINIFLFNANDKDELTDELKELIKENNIEYIFKKGISKDSAIKYLLDKGMVESGYINLIESGSLLNFNVLQNINNTLADYDMHVVPFKANYSNGKIFKTKIPYGYWFFKHFKKQEQMCTNNLELCNCFINADVIKGYSGSDSSDLFNKISLLNYVIGKSQCVRYHKHQCGYFYINNKNIEDDKSKLSIMNSCIKDNHQELVLNLCASELQDILKDHPIEIQRKFKFNMYPFYSQWIMILKYNINYKKWFSLVEK